MSKQAGPSVRDVIDSIVRVIYDSAESDASERLQGAEQKATDSYETIVNDITQKLEEEFERNLRDDEKNLKIREAQITNEVKIEILKSQTEALYDALKESLEKLNEISEGPQYREILTKLIAEGFDRLKEPSVHLVVRKKDLQLTQEVLDDAIKLAEAANPGLKITAKIDTTRFLPQPPQCAGGVFFHCQKGKIRISNLLNDRLKLAYEGMLPHIRNVIMNAPEKDESE